MLMSVLPLCMLVYYVCAVTTEARRGALDPLELLQMVVNHHAGAENSCWHIRDTQNLTD